MNNDYKDKIKEHYLEDTEEIVSLEEETCCGINSQNFILKLSSGQQLLLKVIPECNEAIVRKIEIIDRCRQSGIKVPEVIRTKNDELYAAIDDKYLLFLLKYYSGAKCRFSGEEIVSAGAHLSRLNKKLGEVHDVFFRSHLYDDLGTEELAQIKQVIDTGDGFQKTGAGLLGRLPRLYKKVNDKVKSHKKKIQLVHIDYHPQNVLFKDQEVQVILDFDSIVTAPELQSVAFACDRFANNIEEMKLFLNGYCRKDEPLSQESMGLIPFYIQREALSRINYILRSCFFYQDDKWNFDLDKHVEILEKTEAIKREFNRRDDLDHCE
ncbi:phosphotransferase [Elusimicrobiota bacterium]